MCSYGGGGDGIGCVLWGWGGEVVLGVWGGWVYGHGGWDDVLAMGIVGVVDGCVVYFSEGLIMVMMG